MSTAKGFSLLFSAVYHRAWGDGAEPPGELGVPPSSSTSAHHTHDGLYLGARLGVGWIRASDRDSDTVLAGWGWPLGLSAGFALTRSLILFGEFYEVQIRHPGSLGDQYDFRSLVDLDVLAFGPGVTYYLLPINIFASGSLWLSQLSYRNGIPQDELYGINDTSGWGPLGRFALGKEWWFSSNWGLGFSGEVLLGRLGAKTATHSNRQFSYSVTGFSLLAQASFN